MKKQIDMINGNVLSGMFRFALPIIISSILQVLYNSADTFIVGAYDDPLSMGAVGSAGGIAMIVINVVLGVSVGVNILAARFFGAGDMKALKKYGGTSVAMGAVFGVGMCILGQLIAEPLVELVGIAPEIREKTILYVRIYMLGVPFSSTFNFVSAYLRGTGDTKSPTRGLIISGAVNVFFNIIFVKYCRWGVAGVATATVISLAVAFAFVWIAFQKSSVGVKVRDISIDSKSFTHILKLGFPVGLQNLLGTISNLFTTSAMNSFGAEAISGEAIEIQLENLMCVGIGGISVAIVTFISQNLGAGNYKRIDKVLKTGFAVEALYCIVGAVVIYFISAPFVEIFAHGNAEVAMYAQKKINIILLPFIIVAISDAPMGALRGIGETFPAMLISMVSCLFRIAWIVFLLPYFHTIEVLFVSYQIVWLGGGIASFIIYTVKKKKLYEQFQAQPVDTKKEMSVS